MYYQIVPDEDEEAFKIYILFPGNQQVRDKCIGHFSSMEDALDAIKVYHSRLDR